MNQPTANLCVQLHCSALPCKQDRLVEREHKDVAIDRIKKLGHVQSWSS
jgi:hypothetical protein